MVGGGAEDDVSVSVGLLVQIKMFLHSPQAGGRKLRRAKHAINTRVLDASSAPANHRAAQRCRRSAAAAAAAAGRCHDNIR